MQEEITIEIKEEVLANINNINQNAKDFLQSYLEENLSNIQDLLFNYHYEKRERVYDLKIDKKSISFDGSKGSFKLQYMIGFFNACADLDYNTPEKMMIKFYLNREKSMVTLVGEYWPERGQDEI